MNGYEIVTEALQLQLWCASTKQNLKIINTAIASDNPTLAVARILKGSKITTRPNGDLMVTIKTSNKKLLTQPMSLYKIQPNGFKPDRTNKTIYLSAKPTKALKETKYKSIFECFDKHKITISFN